MSFIKAQKIVRDSHGVIKSGSASLVDAVYDTGRHTGHSRHAVRERLGKVLHLSADGKSGVFLSPTRGLVEYTSSTDTFTSVDSGDPRLPAWVRPPVTEIHTVFGTPTSCCFFWKNAGCSAFCEAFFRKKRCSNAFWLMFSMAS